MNIISVDYYFDGGTAIIKTDEGIMHIDRRLNNGKKNREDTHGKVYDLYPNQELSVVIEDIEKVTNLYNALNNFCVNDNPIVYEERSFDELKEDLQNAYEFLRS